MKFRIFVGVTLTAWATLVALAWWLADRRIEICGYGEEACALRATAARDDILVKGLGIGIAALFLLLFVEMSRARPCPPARRIGHNGIAHTKSVVLGLAARAGKQPLGIMALFALLGAVVLWLAADRRTHSEEETATSALADLAASDAAATAEAKVLGAMAPNPDDETGATELADDAPEGIADENAEAPAHRAAAEEVGDGVEVFN